MAAQFPPAFWRKFPWGSFILRIGVGVAALWLYWHTLAPGTVYFQDAGEFQTKLYTLELIHSTGYPYYQILGKLWTLLLPLGSIAWRINLFSAFCTMISLVCLCCILQQLEVQPWAILGACGALACSPILWSQSIMASVYPMHIMLVALASLALLRWQSGCGSPIWFALACGFGLAHHRVFAFALPAFGIALLLDSNTRRQLWRQGWKLALIVVVIVGFSYLWLIRSGIWPLGALFDFLFLHGREFIHYAPTLPAWAHHLYQAIQLRLIPPFGFWPTLLALLGLLLQFGSRDTLREINVKKQTGILFLALGGVTLISFSAIWVAPDEYRYFLQLDFVLAVGLGLAGDAGGKWLQRRFSRYLAWGVRFLCAAATCVLMWGLYQHNIDGVTGWRDGYADRASRDILATVESHSTIVSSWVLGWPLRYYQSVESMRPDVEVLVTGLEYQATAMQQIESGAPVYFREAMYGLDEEDSPYKWTKLDVAGLYRALPAFPSPAYTRTLDLNFAGGVMLRSLNFSVWPLRPDSFTQLTLDWEMPSAPVNVDLLVQLEDAEGHVRWQSKHSYPDSFALDTASHWQTKIYWVAPPTLPPGDYTLQVALEDSQSRYSLGVGQMTSIPVRAGAVLAPDRLAPQNRLATAQPLPAADPILYLLGYGFLDRELWVEQMTPLSLFWQVARSFSSPPIVSFALETQTAHYPVDFDCPIPVADVGALVESFCALRVSKRTPSGHYRLTVTLDSHTVALQEINVRSRRHLYRTPQMEYKLMAQLGSGITLLGYDLDPPTAQPGQNLVVTLYWRAEAPISSWFKVFTHVIGSDGVLISQHDSPPAEGLAPTSEWVAKEIIVDRHIISIPTEVSASDCMILVGMYSPDTGERLPATGADGEAYANGAIPLQSISIQRPENAGP